MKYLGIDVGSRRVGIAVSDSGGSIAFPLGTIDRRGCADRILQIIADRGIDSVVIGESLDLDGEDNAVMRDVRALSEEIGRRVTVVLEPEQFSTRAAGRLGKGDDAEAAALILQSHLDRGSRDSVIHFE